MKHKVTMAWVQDMYFDAEVNGHHLIMDADSKWGGQDKGPRPKPLMLAALSGCSGMDVVSILDKMKIRDYKFTVDVDGELTDTHPMVYHTITASFFFEGANLPEDKIKKAVLLSTDEYCGVNAMLKKAASVIVKIYINGSEVPL